LQRIIEGGEEDEGEMIQQQREEQQKQKRQRQSLTDKAVTYAFMVQSSKETRFHYKRESNTSLIIFYCPVLM
jgi:hypothetical protein